MVQFAQNDFFELGEIHAEFGEQAFSGHRHRNPHTKKTSQSPIILEFHPNPSKSKATTVQVIEYCQILLQLTNLFQQFAPNAHGFPLVRLKS
jgi:hypothetical protein